MSKDSNIAEIIKHLNELNLSETEQFLNFIKSTKYNNAFNSDTKPINTPKDVDGNEISVGD